MSTRSQQPGLSAAAGPGYRRSGDQQPRILYVPEYKTSAGIEAIEMAAAYGMVLDPWQQLTLNVFGAESDLGKWLCFECGIVCSRQNGKGSILEAQHLAGLTLWGEQLQLYSAHEFKTAQEFFRRIKMFFTEWDDLRKRVKKISEAHGEEGIELLTGQRLRIVARSKRAGRGFSGDRLTWDEAMILGEPEVEASMPTLSARTDATPGGPQLVYAGSAGDESSLVFGRLRNRAIIGGDPSLAFVEWSADEDRYRSLHGQDREDFLDDPAEWARANPAAGYRIPFDHIAKERRGMTSEAFARERLSIGRWPDPTAGTSPISEEQWANAGDETARGQTNPVAFAIGMPWDRSATSIGIARYMEDGRIQIEVIARRQGTAWVLPWLRERVARWEPVAVAIGAGSPAAALEQGWLDDEELDDELLYIVPASDQTTACGAFYDAVVPGTDDDADWSPTLVHRDQQILNTALKSAVKKKTQEAWRFDGGPLMSDIGPLWSVVLARHALIERGEEDYDVLDSVY